MGTLDLKKELKYLYAPSSEDFALVRVPPLSFLMIDGEGNPNTADSYRDAVAALYAVAYAIKFASKRQLGRDYVVAPLEGLWSADDPAAFARRAKDEWRWTMMLLQPAWITAEIVAAALDATRAKKDLSSLPLLRFAVYDEGEAAQILHIGPYDAEAPTLARLHDEYMFAHGLTFNGPHHEIYLGDPRKAAPAKLRTILRQPVVAAR